MFPFAGGDRSDVFRPAGVRRRPSARGHKTRRGGTAWSSTCTVLGRQPASQPYLASCDGDHSTCHPGGINLEVTNSDLIYKALMDGRENVRSDLDFDGEHFLCYVSLFSLG